LGIENNYCADHFISLSIETGEEKAELILEKHQKVVSLFNKSDVGREYLKMTQKDLEKREKTLKNSSQTRVWLGEYLSISHSLKLEKYIKEAMEMWEKVKPKITQKKLKESDWKNMKEFIQVQNPLYIVHKEIEGRDYVTSSLVIPLLFGAYKR